MSSNYILQKVISVLVLMETTVHFRSFNDFVFVFLGVLIVFGEKFANKSPFHLVIGTFDSITQCHIVVCRLFLLNFPYRFVHKTNNSNTQVQFTLFGGNAFCV